MKLRESAIQKAILDYLHKRGIVAWRNNTGVANYNGRRVRFGLPGLPDILGYLPNGRGFAIEVKTPKGRISAEQERVMQELARSNVLVIVATSVQFVADAIERQRTA